MKINKVYLAPMEGVADFPMRKVLTKVGGYDECFSEFIRVTDLVLPHKTLLREVPELETDCKTESNTPVRVQFLGDNAKIIAKSAQRAVAMGAKSIDMNFGCPSRFVHHGGSMLLRETELLHEIVSTLREALDSSIFLSVKVRTGFADKSEAPEIIKAIAVDGVNEIIIHARTRADLYKEDALHWDVIGKMHEYANGIPLVANGDICSYEDANKCFAKTHCDRMMIGRAALAVPNIGHVLKSHIKAMSTAQILFLVLDFQAELVKMNTQEKSVMDRTKQFLGFARRGNSHLTDFFKVFCRVQNLKDASYMLESMIKTLEDRKIED